MIVNHFKMRSNVMTYNLSGMGCSAGVISIGLAQQLLQVGSPWAGPGREVVGRHGGLMRTAGARWADGWGLPCVGRLCIPCMGSNRRRRCLAPACSGVPQLHLPGGLHREHHPELVRRGRGGGGGCKLIQAWRRSAVHSAAGTCARRLAAACTAATPRHPHHAPRWPTPPPRRYFGNDKSMLIPNCLFRLGGAAMLLSNK